MAIPDFQTVMRPVLQSVGDGESRSLADVRDIVKDAFGLTDEERRVRLPSGHQTVINNRTGWARTYLNKAGLLTIPQRGMVQITERGLDVLEKGPERISVAWLKQFPEFKEFHTQKSGVDASAIKQPEVVEVSNETPDEQLAAAHLSLMESLADEVLESVFLHFQATIFFSQLAKFRLFRGQFAITSESLSIGRFMLFYPATQHIGVNAKTPRCLCF